MKKVGLAVTVAAFLPLASLAQFQKFDPKNPPAPGAGIDAGIMNGSELSRRNDQYPDHKKFWGEDAISRVFNSISVNSSDFLAQMWRQYGPQLPNEALWHENLRTAIAAAKEGSWSKVEHDCAQCIANNPNAADAKLLRSLALKKMNQPAKSQLDVEILQGTKQRATSFLRGDNSKAPVADTILRQVLQSQASNESKGVRDFGNLQQEIRSNMK